MLRTSNGIKNDHKDSGTIMALHWREAPFSLIILFTNWTEELSCDVCSLVEFIVIVIYMCVCVHVCVIRRRNKQQCHQVPRRYSPLSLSLSLAFNFRLQFCCLSTRWLRYCLFHLNINMCGIYVKSISQIPLSQENSLLMIHLHEQRCFQFVGSGKLQLL